LNNFTLRTITGVVFVVVLIGSILLSAYTYLAVFLLITAGALLEFYRLAEKNNIKTTSIYAIICGLLAFIVTFLTAGKIIDDKYLLLILPLLFVIPVTGLFHKSGNPFTGIAWTIFGLFYIALPMSLVNYIRFHSESTGILIGYFIIIWSYDTCAYLVGISIGRHRLFERISPKKSWEGAIGGAILTMGVTWVISVFFTSLVWYQWLIIASIIIVTGTFGDLFESLFKRSIGIKDSGNMIPGHGGFLDRFDALLLSSPFVFAYLQLFC
jgi:phosphatidate cytidylyltransferase